MKIESDRARILSGVRYGLTIGSPIALLIDNRDWENWRAVMCVEEAGESARSAPLTEPRPGHADLAGAVKFQHRDMRNVIERASARETAMRVGLAAICRKFFLEFRVTAASHVIKIGGLASAATADGIATDAINARADANAVRCLDDAAAGRMIAVIDAAKTEGDTVGGEFETIIAGLPVGLGSGMQPDRRLDALLAAAVMSIPGVKSVSIGLGHEFAERLGSESHDRILPDGSCHGYRRGSNLAGGIEGGMSTGEPVVIHAVMKPLSTLARPLETVNLATGEVSTALTERSDVCAVPAASIVGEAVCLLALMNPFLEKFGGDSMLEIRRHFDTTQENPWR